MSDAENYRVQGNREEDRVIRELQGTLRDKRKECEAWQEKYTSLDGAAKTFFGTTLVVLAMLFIQTTRHSNRVDEREVIAQELAATQKDLESLRATTKAGKCRDAFAVIDGPVNPLTGICPFEGMTIDTAWNGNGHLALCRCGTR